MTQSCADIEISPIAGTIGAEINGIDLSGELSPAVSAALMQALLDHLVIYLPQAGALSPADLRRFAQKFGQLDQAPFVYPFKIPSIEGYPEIFNNIKEANNSGINIGGFWHADVTYRQKPHKASVMYAKQVPDVGGDTQFANQYLAYEALPKEMQEKLEGMQAVHSSAMPHGKESARFAAVSRDHVPAEQDRDFSSSDRHIDHVEVIETVHPVVRRHPQTGRKVLYVNRAFTSHFVGMTIEQSLPLLEALWHHASRAEFTCRIRWSSNAVVVWDNCASHHYAINDYYGQRRHMQRIAVHED